MLRGRDLVAALLAVLLTRMAWTENYMSESLSVSLHLAFYSPWKSSQEQNTAPPVPMDVDGDGTVEAFALFARSNDTASPTWTLQVVDLKPLHRSQANGPQAPFRPNVLFTSPTIESTNSNDVFPLKMTSGHILVHHPHHRLHEKHHSYDKGGSNNDNNDNERSRHYFCGVDWHDAANNCHSHCPGGAANECPEGMTCYADTPCDARHKHHTMAEDNDFYFKLELTPGGGLPSIATVWSDGTVTLHSITADFPQDEQETTKKHRAKRQKASSTTLELREMWRKPILESLESQTTVLEEYDVLLLGAEDVQPGDKKDVGKYGLVVVGGSYTSPDTDYSLPFVQALDSMTGDSLWQEEIPYKKTEEAGLFGAPVRGSSSFARRRSRIASIRAQQEPANAGLPNCLMGYKYSLIDPHSMALPHAYWGSSDMKLLATHLDHRRKPKPKKKKTDKVGRKKWHAALTGKRRHPKKTPAVYGRPNVLVSHHQGGLNVLSLKNGRAVCHLSLLDKVLYADLNYDGLLDHVQVITDENTGIVDSETGEFKDKWVADLSKRIAQDTDEEGKKKFGRLSMSNRLCHVLALSGMPAREELFSAQVCPSFGPNKRGDHPSLKLQAAAPLAVELMDGDSDGGSDVVVALNSGVVSRYQVSTGRRQWQLHNSDDLPTWGSDSSSSPVVGRIDFTKATYAPWIRPILVTGEDGMAILSTGKGGLMASASFPQTAIGKPVLADLSGDGTTDVVITSADAIWGYQVVVRTGGSIMLRIMVGLLMAFIGLAILRNRFGQRKGVDKRSTDS